MEILEIFQNPIVIAFLIWILSSFFRGKPKEEDAQKQKQQGKTRQQPKPVFTTVEQPKQRRAEQQLKETVQNAYEKIKSETVEQITPSSTTRDRRPISTRSKKENEVKVTSVAGTKSAIQLNKQSVIQGVIWSEILGPPRSKNPHFPKGMKR
ncbi:hypothetical protein ACFFIX_01080 [Metabacillus herbersteinensis]|uniref:Uncharacterized protein n=1 Tax=Metabacillus herbersteinensis TaxID=283816 RepID=A0ABV6G8P8_9BACI